MKGWFASGVGVAIVNVEVHTANPWSLNGGRIAIIACASIMIGMTSAYTCTGVVGLWGGVVVGG